MTWILSGLKRTDSERAEFALTSDLAAKLDVFLQGVIVFVQRWHYMHTSMRIGTDTTLPGLVKKNHTKEGDEKRRHDHREKRLKRLSLARRVADRTERNEGNDGDAGDADDEDCHIDSWDSTFQELESTFRDENKSAAVTADFFNPSVIAASIIPTAVSPMPAKSLFCN